MSSAELELAGATATPAGGSGRLVAVLSSLPNCRDLSDSLVCVGGTLSEASCLGSILSHLLMIRFGSSTGFSYNCAVSLIEFALAAASAAS